MVGAVVDEPLAKVSGVEIEAGISIHDEIDGVTDTVFPHPCVCFVAM